MRIMIFNMGGRLGQEVCKRLFERRGFLVTKLWQTKVMQAADTNIIALVEIEKNSLHRFEFFMGLVGDQPICAHTAWAYVKSGCRISQLYLFTVVKFASRIRLDINPRAVKVAWINLFLNALDDNGLPIYDEEGKTLLDREEFHESDLLSYCRDNKIELERIIGCIPQILNPNPEAMSKIVTENASMDSYIP